VCAVSVPMRVPRPAARITAIMIGMIGDQRDDWDGAADFRALVYLGALATDSGR